MTLSLRRTLLVVALVLVLIMALLSWSITLARSAVPSHPATYHSSHMLAWYCPPPPRNC